MGFGIHTDYYTDINEYMALITAGDLPKVYKHKYRGGYYVYNIPCAFDIETSSFYDNGEKRAIMYIWQFAFNGYVFIGRTWGEFLTFCGRLSADLNLSENLILYVYIHNLSYEFQFIRKRFNWLNVFSVDTREPVKALCDLYIQFNDSYILSGYSLATVGKNLHKYHVKKLVGDLDYTVLRTPKTPLTDNEINYCINDVLVVSAYIQEYIENVGKITLIPLTQTGAVREFCRKNCYYGFSKNEDIQQQTYYDYRGLMETLQINDLEEYKLLKRAFQGGFTHANAVHVKRLCENVGSYDFTSSYPYVMLSELYPMGRGFKVENMTREKYNQYAQQYLIVFDLHLIGVQPKVDCDNPISISRCYSASNYIVNNGRVVFADDLYLSATNIDLQVYLAFYDFEHIEINNCYCYAKGYLPRNFILSILKVYNDKTKLKNVAGKEREYLHSKELLNSMYGMSVTDIVQDLITYDNDCDWGIELQDKDELIEKYNRNKKRFLYYPWGIFVTAYARKNLFSGILECQNDYIYCDTDSIKILKAENHKEYFDNYNSEVVRKLKAMCNHYKIKFDLCKPKTIQGKEKLIGIWDYEGEYQYFKTLGAKRYLYYDGEELHATVAGVSKQGVVKYLNEKYNGDLKKIFNAFDNKLTIPPDYTGKLTHTYIDDEKTGLVKDCNGAYYEYDEKSFIHLEKTAYNMSLSQAFIDYLKGVKTKNEI